MRRGAQKDTAPRGLRDKLRNLRKYQSINFLATAEHGSVEFRHYGGTIDENRLRIWVNILLSLVRAAENLPPLDINGLLQRASQMGPLRFAQWVFGPYWEYLDSPDAEQMIYTGLRQAQFVEQQINAGLSEKDWWAQQKRKFIPSKGE
jgi:hypothetical protein